MQPFNARPWVRKSGGWSPVHVATVRTLLACLLTTAMLIVWTAPSSAQSPVQSPAESPQSFRIPRYTLQDIEQDEVPAPVTSAATQSFIVDADPGVDDAAALVWLFSQNLAPVDVLGIVTVSGNTTLANATNNAQLVLHWLDRSDVPVIPGADRPLAVNRSSTGMLIHGPDGLWSLGQSNPQVPPPDSTPSAAEFYCSTLAGSESMIKVLALGPLTNLASAISHDGCGVNWSQVQIVSLGGAKMGGNQTPVTEFNYWQDPEAAIQVLASGAQLTIVTLDGFSQFTITQPMLTVLASMGVPAMQMLLPALQTYVSMLSGGGVAPALPDPAAAMVAVHSGLGLGQPGLVRILESQDVPEYVRGQTIIALTSNSAEWIALAADDATMSALAQIAFTRPGLFLLGIARILNDNPPNAMVVPDILARPMTTLFIQGVTGPLSKNDSPVASSMGETSLDDALDSYRLFLPSIEITEPSE